jgi:phosphoglycolate phosphatase-like HAD superfamily hydrolase
LKSQDFGSFVCEVAGRTSADPGLLKPSPYLLNQALRKLEAQPEECVLVGDSLSDLEAAQSAGVSVIGFANKPGKESAMATLSPDVIVSSMHELAT